MFNLALAYCFIIKMLKRSWIVQKNVQKKLAPAGRGSADTLLSRALRQTPEERCSLAWMWERVERGRS